MKTTFRANGVTVLCSQYGVDSVVSIERSEKKAESIAKWLNFAYTYGSQEGIKEATAYGAGYSGFMAEAFGVEQGKLIGFMKEHDLTMIKKS